MRKGFSFFAASGEYEERKGEEGDGATKVDEKAWKKFRDRRRIGANI